MLNYLFFKRLFDILLALFLMIFTAPLMAVIALLILIELRSNPIFTQKRAITLSKKQFTIYKFRTLDIRSQTCASASFNNIFNKPYLINFVSLSGRFLRKTALDELPQLYNILKGEMSFVGPRPLSVEDLIIMRDCYPGQYHKREKVSSEPGLTGLWQVKGERAKGMENLIEYDLQYEKIKSPSADLSIIISTILLILKSGNSDAILCSSLHEMKNDRIITKPINPESNI